MKTEKQLAKAREIEESETRCTHCKRAELTRTDHVITDTTGARVRVWECPRCEYSEGRPEL